MKKWLAIGALIPVSYTHLDVYKRQPEKCVILDWHIVEKNLVSDGEKTVDISQTSFYTKHVKKTRGACVPG